MFKRILSCLFAALLFQGAVAATVQQQEVKRLFAPPPAEALKALKAAVGKPFTAGYVFIDGKYIKPPYKVERYGTVIRINGHQVTDQIIPWQLFVKTQPGAVATKVAPPPAAEGAEEPAAEPEPEPEPEAEEVEDDDDEMTLDDLFDDVAVKSSKPKAAKKAKKAKKASKGPKVVYSLDGEFVMNDASRALLEKINTVRTRIDTLLRTGGYACFSSRYTPVRGDVAVARSVVDKLPDLMKRYSDREAFRKAARQAGLSYLPTALIDDFHRNRFDYLLLVNRKKSDAEMKQWMNLAN